jgi:glycosyltransferase involved in cell wall biosynthesis
VITGILDHETLSELLPLASLAVVPSKWPEAFGMVAVEAMASGVLPLCNYHAGLRDVVDEVAAASPELGDLIKLERDKFIDQLPGKIRQALNFLYPHGYRNQTMRQKIGKQLRHISLEKFSWDGISKRLLQ